MFSPDMNYEVVIEQHNDRLRQIEREQRLWAVEQATGRAWHLSACRWLGRRLTTWGAWLEQHGRPSGGTPVIQKT